MTGRRVRLWVCAGCLLSATAAAQNDYSFDAGEFDKKPLELSGYGELTYDRYTLDPQAALYQLNFFDQAARSHIDRAGGALQLDALYRRGRGSFRFVGYGSYTHDYTGGEGDAKPYEAYFTVAPSDRVTVDLGKKTLRWGKGYAWNPAGFIERPKDPNDPELAREGYVLAGADLVRSGDGALKTVALTPLVVPVNDSLNDDFGRPDHWNPAAKLYLLYRDTDVDFMLLGNGSRSTRYGADFSRNLATNLEIHGEWAHVTESDRQVVDAAGGVTPVRASADSYLIGLRHLSARDLTTIVEYYYNGAGYRENEMRDFFTFAHDAYDRFTATGDDTLLLRARTLLAAYARPTPMRRYVYLRLSQKEPFDILYFTPALTAIVNADDHSYSLAPELLYAGVTNLELRARLFILSGARLSDFGERQNDRRFELRARYFF